MSDKEKDNIEEKEVQEEKNPLEEKIETLEDEKAQLQDKLIRNLAEFDNFRKRTITEKTAMYDNGAKDTVEKLLPVLDNLERAVNACEDTQSPLFKGVDMVLNQLKEIFSSIGVEEIMAEGETFDPNYHNAVMHIEDENIDENIVVEVLQKGYKYNDRVIRPSMVKVAN